MLLPFLFLFGGVDVGVVLSGAFYLGQFRLGPGATKANFGLPL